MRVDFILSLEKKAFFSIDDNQVDEFTPWLMTTGEYVRLNDTLYFITATVNDPQNQIIRHFVEIPLVVPK